MKATFFSCLVLALVSGCFAPKAPDATDEGEDVWVACGGIVTTGMLSAMDYAPTRLSVLPGETLLVSALPVQKSE